MFPARDATEIAGRAAEKRAIAAIERRPSPTTRTTSRRSSSSRSRAKAGTTISAPSSSGSCAGSPIENELILIFDEVQTGVGLTGKMWCVRALRRGARYRRVRQEDAGVRHLASNRIDEGRRTCSRCPSRINSTWGGNLVDMVRSQRYLEIIEEDGLVEHAATVGAHLLKGLEALAAAMPNVALEPARPWPDVRDRPASNGATRDKVADKAYDPRHGDPGVRPAEPAVPSADRRPRRRRSTRGWGSWRKAGAQV